MVEADYPDLFRAQPGRGSWLTDMLARLAVRYPENPIVSAGSRGFAEEWASLGAAAADRRRNYLARNAEVISLDGGPVDLISNPTGCSRLSRSRRTSRPCCLCRAE